MATPTPPRLQLLYAFWNTWNGTTWVVTEALEKSTDPRRTVGAAARAEAADEMFRTGELVRTGETVTYVPKPLSTAAAQLLRRGLGFGGGHISDAVRDEYAAGVFGELVEAGLAAGDGRVIPPVPFYSRPDVVAAAAEYVRSGGGDQTTRTWLAAFGVNPDRLPSQDAIENSYVALTERLNAEREVPLSSLDSGDDEAMLWAVMRARDEGLFTVDAQRSVIVSTAEPKPEGTHTVAPASGQVAPKTEGKAPEKTETPAVAPMAPAKTTDKSAPVPVVAAAVPDATPWLASIDSNIRHLVSVLASPQQSARDALHEGALLQSTLRRVMVLLERHGVLTSGELQRAFNGKLRERREALEIALKYGVSVGALAATGAKNPKGWGARYTVADPTRVGIARHELLNEAMKTRPRRPVVSAGK